MGTRENVEITSDAPENLSVESLLEVLDLATLVAARTASVRSAQPFHSPAAVRPG